MPAKHFEIGVEIVENEGYQGKARFLPFRDGPVMREDLSERFLIQQSGYLIIARKVADASFGFQKCLLNLTVRRI